jgi:hypothetical protein
MHCHQNEHRVAEAVATCRNLSREARPLAFRLDMRSDSQDARCTPDAIDCELLRNSDAGNDDCHPTLPFSGRLALTPFIVITHPEAPVGIEPTNSRFAVCRLTTWPRRRTLNLTARNPRSQAEPFRIDHEPRGACPGSGGNGGPLRSSRYRTTRSPSPVSSIS